MRISAVTLAAASLVSSAALAERPAVIDTTRTTEVTLAYELARGDSQSYLYTTSFQAEELERGAREELRVELSMPVSYEVQNVDGSGVALVAISLRPPTITAARVDEALETSALETALRSARLTASIATDGTVVERAGDFTPATNPEDAYIMGFVSDNLAIHWAQFPQEPVSIGDSWLQIVPMDMHDTENGLSATISVRYTLSGFAQTPVGEVAVIDAVYTTVIDGQLVDPSGRGARVVGRGLGEGYLLFDYANGRLYEVAMHDGTVLTATENNGQRTTTAFTQDVSIRAQVVAAALPQ